MRLPDQSDPKAPSFATERPLSDIFESQLTLTSTVSITPSASTSFRKREAELETIDRRFGAAIARKRPRARVQSRFREEFDSPTSIQSRRGTFIAKVQRSLERRSKTRSRSTDDMRDHGLPSHLIEGSSIPRRNHKVTSSPRLYSPVAYEAEGPEHKSDLYDETAVIRRGIPREKSQPHEELRALQYYRAQKACQPLERQKVSQTQSNTCSILHGSMQQESKLEPINHPTFTPKSSQQSTEIEPGKGKGSKVGNHLSGNSKWSLVEAHTTA